jgi:hypothetical protein
MTTSKQTKTIAKRIETWLFDADTVSMAFHSPVHKIRKSIDNTKIPEERHALTLRLRERLAELDAEAPLRMAVEESMFNTALAVKAWEDALTSLATTGGVVADQDNWRAVGTAALQANELDIALRAFAGGPSAQSVIAEHAVARKLGRKAKRSLASITDEITENVEDLRAHYKRNPGNVPMLELVSALVERATLETLLGKAKAASATLDEVYSYPRGKWRDPVESDPVALLAGLEPRTAPAAKA